MARAAYFTRDGFTGHQKGLIGHTINTGIFPFQPASSKAFRPYSGGSGSNVHAVSVPSSVGTPNFRSIVRDSSLRVMIRASLQYRPHIFAIDGSMYPASDPYPTASLFCAVAVPSEPMIIVVSALANLLLKAEPSTTITP